MIRNIVFSTTNREELIDITERVNAIVKESGIDEGICLVYAPHASAAITINENADPNIQADITDALDKIVARGVWRHDKVDGNADSHIKASIIGSDRMIPVKDNRLMLGRWQDIFFVELDGPREGRKVIVQLLPASRDKP